MAEITHFMALAFDFVDGVLVAGEGVDCANPAAAIQTAQGQWKLFGGYEHIQLSNPNNPLNAGAFLQGGYIGGAVNNLNFITTKTLQTAWVGVRYAITPALESTTWDRFAKTSDANANKIGCTAEAIYLNLK